MVIFTHSITVLGNDDEIFSKKGNRNIFSFIHRKVDVLGHTYIFFENH
jgi:hypothetical protein